MIRTYSLHGLKRRMVNDPAEDVASDCEGVVLTFQLLSLNEPVRGWW